ncbi:MAG: efflux RND transporter periplasmic adaptor subunit [Muribaculaceae bacterium]|nr:efflux RND transporter periplasmic adaptor subunit [Muribaculaceae bacterium]
MGVVLVALVAVSIIGFLFLNKPAEIIEGQADATSVKISGKLPGRVVELYVSEGDNVRKGDTLVHIHSALADAKMMQAVGMKEVATSQNKKIDAGTRIQIIQTARELVNQAKAALDIAKKTYDRMEALYQKGVVSAQKRDEAQAAYNAAKAAEQAARSQLALAEAGAQQEDKTSAEAMVSVAQGGIDEVEALLEDQYLVAPCDGQIDQVYPNEGELVMLGSPIMSLLKISDKWVTFNIREDKLKDLKMGEEITIEIPALDKETKAKVYYISDLGSYATWRATKTTGQWDSRTFKVKARPLDSIPELRPGMTVLLK